MKTPTKFIPFLAAFVFFVSAFVFINSNQPSQETQEPLALATITPGLPSLTPTLPPQYLKENYLSYRLDIDFVDKTTDYSCFGDYGCGTPSYLSHIFSIPLEDLSLAIRRTDKGIFMAHYLSFPATYGNLEPLYEDEYATINTTQLNSSEAPYIHNINYCEKDSDCSVNMTVCFQNARNKYHPYIPLYGCGPEAMYQTYGIDDQYYIKRGCYPSVSFTHADCQNNLCVPQGATIKCLDPEEL